MDSSVNNVTNWLHTTLKSDICKQYFLFFLALIIVYIKIKLSFFLFFLNLHFFFCSQLKQRNDYSADTCYFSRQMSCPSVFHVCIVSSQLLFKCSRAEANYKDQVGPAVDGGKLHFIQTSCFLNLFCPLLDGYSTLYSY